ncbi:hypothetical protein NL676_027343 [Syzygium grande]|nr:hypothetical protein NL676_027343 [Syzygium grande]
MGSGPISAAHEEPKTSPVGPISSGPHNPAKPKAQRYSRGFLLRRGSLPPARQRQKGRNDPAGVCKPTRSPPPTTCTDKRRRGASTAGERRVNHPTDALARRFCREREREVLVGAAQASSRSGGPSSLRTSDLV